MSMDFDELKEDLSIIAKDMFNAAVEELNDVSPYFDTKDLVYLGKKLLRNTNNLSKMLDQVESLNDLAADLKPLSKQIFDEILDNLNKMDNKGYFIFAKEAFAILDTIITSFSVEDVRLLKENIVKILLTVKSMTQPDVLGSVNNALDFFKQMDIEIDKEITIGRLLKQMRDPEVKRGLYFMLEFVKNISTPKNNQIISNN